MSHLHRTFTPLARSGSDVEKTSTLSVGHLALMITDVGGLLSNKPRFVLFVHCLRAHQELRSKEPGIDVVAVYCHSQHMASQRAFNVPSAQKGYLRQKLVSPKAEIATSRLIRQTGIWPWEYSCSPLPARGDLSFS
jgi:hypothetical protein